MIALYKLEWSHYVEKVILALEYKRIPWYGVDVNPFSKKEMRKFACRQYVPLVHDEARGVALSDSSPILKYLEDSFPGTPRLFPGDDQQGEEIYRWTIALDSHLGVPARRIAYTHMAVDNSAPSPIRPESTYKSGKVVQTSGATSAPSSTLMELRDILSQACCCPLPPTSGFTSSPYCGR